MASSKIRKDFYNSDAWKKVRIYIWLKQNLLCNRCGRAVYVDGISKWIPKEKRLIGIVHHINYLNDTNIANVEISLNENNLEGICIDCHNEEHILGTGVTKKDVMFDSDGNLIPKPSTRTNNYTEY